MHQLGENSLRGSYVPIITPFRDGAIDFKTLEQLVDFQVAGGSTGIMVTGTSGEPTMLSTSERIAVIEAAAQLAAGRLRILAAVGGQSLEETLAMTAAISHLNVEALVVVTPYYSKPPQEGLIAYYIRVAQESKRPVLLYHIPRRAGVAMSVGSIVEVVERSEGTIMGIKHSDSDNKFAAHLLEALGTNFRLFGGIEHDSLALLAMGASGLINTVGNLVPRTLSDLVASCHSGDFVRARAVYYSLLPLSRALFMETNPVPLKYLMWRCGLLPSNEHRLPLVGPAPRLADELDRFVDQYHLKETVEQQGRDNHE